MTSPVLAITGGNSGIGLAITKLFLQQGYRVAILARSLALPQELQGIDSDSLLYVSGDASKVKDLDAFYHAIANCWGKVDVVIANAGIALPQSVADVTESNFEQTLAINLKGVFFTVQRALPHLNSKAAIILMSSIQAKKGAGVWSVYGATKAAVRSLARSFAEELSPQGIRVNALSPGVTDTPILNKFGFSSSDLIQILDGVAERTPLGRIGDATEIAQAALFLASTQSSFMTGADLQVDGGLAQV